MQALLVLLLFFTFARWSGAVTVTSVSSGPAQYQWLAQSQVAGPDGQLRISLGPTPANPATQAFSAWPNGGPVAFQLAWNGTTASYTVGSSTVNYTPGEGYLIGEFYLTLLAGLSGSQVSYQNVQVNGLTVGNFSSSGPASVQIWRVSQFPVGQFVVTGTMVLSWSGASPSFTDLATDIKIVGGRTIADDITATPEPGSAALCLLGGGTLAFLARRRSC